ncbi:archease [Candidatus Bathyarchaeota archaeon]|nr:archease [Candidatus Bathyarchaeota archaeon]
MGDAYVEAYGSSLEEAYSNAALAMFEVMTDTRNVEPRFEQPVTVEGHDLNSLLYSWLESLLVKFEVENRLFSRFMVEKIGTEGDLFKLKARVFGEDLDHKKHPSKTEVKAVTYHLMEIESSGPVYRLRFLLDL